MTAMLCPVLAVAEPAAALDWFARLPGVTVDRTRGEARAGGDRLLVTDRAGAQGTREPFDHLALRVGDVDGLLATLRATGAALHPAFTPDGPREIAAFWDTGVRFVFLVGPEGVPIELCARRGTTDPRPAVLGLDHLGLRAADTAATAARLRAGGATDLASHILPGDRPVSVAFLQEDGLVWEVFDEPAPPGLAAGGAWSGVRAAG
jgi:catechol 2,3-dioxygenase-like lactoylglutathione lyase family enzyme